MKYIVQILIGAEDPDLISEGPKVLSKCADFMFSIVGT